MTRKPRPRVTDSMRSLAERRRAADAQKGDKWKTSARRMEDLVTMSRNPVALAGDVTRGGRDKNEH